MARSGPGTWKASPPADSIARRTRNSRRASTTKEDTVSVGVTPINDRADDEDGDGDADAVVKVEGDTGEEGDDQEEDAEGSEQGNDEEHEEDGQPDGEGEDGGSVDGEDDEMDHNELEGGGIIREDDDDDGEVEVAATQEGFAEEEDFDLAKDADDGAAGCSDEEEIASNSETSAADVGQGRHFQDSNQDSAQDSDSTRTRMKLDTHDIAVVAPQTWHADWKSWQKYFEEYCERTMQVIPILETMGYELPHVSYLAYLRRPRTNLPQMVIVIDRTIRQTQKRLAGVLIKYAQSSEKKPVFRKMKNPILILDPFYILPPKLMDNCMKIVPMKNTNQNPVDVDEDDGAASRSGAVTEVVQIKDVGSFSRKQLELMRRVEIMKNTVQQGFDAHTWILEAALPALPAEYHELVSHVGDEIMHTFPDAHIEGLENDPANKYSMLYRVVPPIWLSDAAIRAVCDRLVADYTACRFAGLLDVATKSTRAKTSGEQMVSRTILDRIVAQTMESGVETVLLPLNFHNAHWCCVVVKVLTNRIFYYDPLNQKAYMRAAKDVAVHLKHGGLLNYDVVPQNNPIQFDQFSCGVFVCWMFLRQVVTDLTPDMSDNSLVQRRFELFYYILTGRLIAPTKNRAETAYTPVQPPLDEDKDTVPTSQNSDHEETPPTQVAA